jgi:AcrR family transcriptional regulator
VSLRDEHRRARREAILAGARRIIATRGIDALSMKDLASQARVGVTTLYRIYGSKAEILGALLDELAARVVEETARSEPADPLAAVLELIRTSVRHVLADRRVQRALAEANAAASPRLWSPTTIRITSAIAAHLEDGVRAGLLVPETHPEVVAIAVHSAYGTSARMWAQRVLRNDQLEDHALHGVLLCLAGVASDRGRPALLRELARTGEALEDSGFRIRTVARILEDQAASAPRLTPARA